MGGEYELEREKVTKLQREMETTFTELVDL